MIGGEKAILKVFLKMKKTSFILFLFIFFSCSYSKQEKIYISQLKDSYSDFNFKLPDRLTGLDLVAYSLEKKPDSILMKRVIRDARILSKSFSDVNWIYMQFYWKKSYLMTLRLDENDSVIFMKNRH